MSKTAPSPNNPVDKRIREVFFICFASLKNCFRNVKRNAPIIIQSTPTKSRDVGICPKRKKEKRITKNGRRLSSGPKTDKSFRAKAWTYTKKAELVMQIEQSRYKIPIVSEKRTGWNVKLYRKTGK